MWFRPCREVGRPERPQLSQSPQRSSRRSFLPAYTRPDGEVPGSLLHPVDAKGLSKVGGVMQLVCGYFQLDVAGVLRRRARRLDFVGNAIYYRSEGRDRAIGLEG